MSELAAVFAVLGVLPLLVLVVLAQLGIIIFVGVLLVRTVLVPALNLKLGERFWWPRRVAAVSPAVFGFLQARSGAWPDPRASPE